MSKFLFLISILVTLCSCKEKKTIYIASYTQECQGVAPQTCMLIKETVDAEWQLFYDRIDGFNYERGYNYLLEVEISEVENPMADASSLRYSLIKVISKEKTATEQRIDSSSKSQEDIQSIEYDALSRGYFINLKINQNTIEKSTDREMKSIVSKKCLEKDWDAISSLLESVEIDQISELEAPSGKRLFDGAPHAQLKITTNRNMYISAGFDHGNPPKEIKELVDQILSLSESIE